MPYHRTDQYQRRLPTAPALAFQPVLRAATRVVVLGVYELVAQRAAALALVEPVGQQDEFAPVVVQTACVARKTVRHYRQTHGFRVPMKLRDGLVIHIPLFRKHYFVKSTFSLFVKFYLTVGVSYVIFELAHLHVVEGVFGVVLNGRL